MKRKAVLIVCGVLTGALPVLSAYHHEGESDSARFLAVYTDKAGTKLDHCALCHTGGEYEQNGRMVSMGSCQWCHYTYGYEETGDIELTLNQYGKDFYNHGRSSEAVREIEQLDSDGDGFSNLAEIQANRFPGDQNDDPDRIPAPSRIYTRAELESFPSHTQFLLMNTSKSGDFYAEYTGVVIEDILRDAQISEDATGITVFSPDGWSQYHPLRNDPDPAMYPVIGAYPQAIYYATFESWQWCDYSSPSCLNIAPLSPIPVENGLKLILAYRREGESLTPGELDDQNRLDGEGPYRVIVPQKVPYPPDQSSSAENQSVLWPYNNAWDHNAGVCTRSATMIRVEPLPEGTTDIDVMESGWSFIDKEAIIIYGAIARD